jgi:hypothetical protein
MTADKIRSLHASFSGSPYFSFVKAMPRMRQTRFPAGSEFPLADGRKRAKCAAVLRIRV